MAGITDVDDILIALGRLGKFQVKQMVFLYLTILSLTFHVLSVVFIGYRPEYTCRNVSVSAVNFTNSTFINDDSHTWKEYGQCTIKTFTNSSGGVQVNETGCTDGWTFADLRKDQSFASEWDLVCDQESLSELTQMLYMFGQGIGGVVFTSLSDRYGRKPVHVSCHVGLSMIALATAFAPTYTWFAVMRLVTGALQEGTGLTEAVMIIELVPRETRGLADIIGFLSWSTGIALVTPIAYLFRNHSWRHLQICLALLTSWSLIEWWLIDESLRWLIANGKTDKAKAIIKKACRLNKKNVDAILDKSGLRDIDDGSTGAMKMTALNKATSADKVTPDSEVRKPLSGDTPAALTSVQTKRYTMLDVFKSKRLLTVSVILWFSWITNSLVYYGLFLMSSSLAGDRFLNFFLGSIVEYPAALVKYLMINRCGRKITTITFHAICGIAMIIASILITLAVVPDNISILQKRSYVVNYCFDQCRGIALIIASILIRLADGSTAMALASTGFTLIGKFGITGSFSTIFLYTPELYPTNMRTVGYGMASATCRIGGMLAPFSRKMLDVGVWFPGLVFGILCGIVTVSFLWVPETNKHELPQKLEECEAWYQENQFKLPCGRGRSKVPTDEVDGTTNGRAQYKRG